MSSSLIAASVLRDVSFVIQAASQSRDLLNTKFKYRLVALCDKSLYDT
jgi:hypothetical protein